MFSITNAAVTLSTYLLCFLAVRQSTGSWTQAVVQLLFISVPDCMDNAKNILHVYTKILEERAKVGIHDGP